MVRISAYKPVVCVQLREPKRLLFGLGSHIRYDSPQHGIATTPHGLLSKAPQNGVDSCNLQCDHSANQEYAFEQVYQVCAIDALLYY
jgi:hypothetical protein